MTKEILKKIQVMLILFAIMITGLVVKSMAVDYTCTLTLEPDKTQVKVGETVTFSIKVSNINAGEGIAIFNTTLNYDTNVFDMKVQGDSAGAWTSTNIENSLTFTKSNYEATNTDQEIGKIVLTAKENATLGKQTVTLTKNEFSDSESFSVADVSKQIEVVQKSSGEDNNNPDPNPNPNPNPDPNPGPGTDTNKPSTNTGNNSVIKTNTGVVNTGKSNSTLPKTGVQDFLIGAIIVTVILTIGFYVKYRKSY